MPDLIQNNQDNQNTIQTALGFDFGLAKIGVASGQAITKTATPVAVLKAKEGQPDWREIEILIKKYKPQALVVGLPLNMDESENFMCVFARKFANRLHGRFGKVVYLIDERLSSTGVGYILEDMGQNPYARTRKRIDDLAACLILETFFKSPIHKILPIQTQEPLSEAKNLVVLVDPLDKAIGQEEKLKAHQLGLLHRAFSVFVFRKNTISGELELLLQQRNPNKYHSGGLWTNTCCSHPQPNENIVDSGERRLWEEMGIQTDLKDLGYFIYKAAFSNGLTEHELDHVLSGEWDGSFTPNPEEVAETKWSTLSDLDDWLKAEPKNFTEWFKEAYELWKLKLLQTKIFTPIPSTLSIPSKQNLN